jgi:hypothetical protein
MMNKQDAGRLGGLKTASKYGNEYMSQLARRGAVAFHIKYKLVPIRLNNFAIVNRETGEMVNTIIGISR